MRLKILLVMLLALWMPAANAAKTKPVHEIERLPEEQEEQDLWELASNHENRLRNSGDVIDDPHVEAYLESIADSLVGDSLDHLGIRLDFVVVARPTLSAWVYPYGTIAIHSGLLVRMDNEAQFAAILAHEISHFMQRHSYRELVSENRQSVLGKGLGLLATAVLAKETGTIDTGLMDATGDLWVNLATSGYSKKNEYTADEEGLMLMGHANLSRDEAIPAFQALAENEAYGAGDPRQMWSSHPKLEDRLDNLDKEIKKEKRRKKTYVPGEVPDVADYNRGIAPIFLVNAKLDIAVQQFGRARESLQRYLTVHPDDSEALFLLGETYRRENPRGPEFDNRLNAYQQAVDNDSGYANAYKELGMAYRVQGKSAEARDAFKHYLQIAAEAPDAGIIRGYMEGL